MNEPLFICALDTAKIKNNGLIVEDEQSIDLSTAEFYFLRDGVISFDLKHMTRKRFNIETVLSNDRDGHLENMFKCNFALTSESRDVFDLIKRCYYEECQEKIEFIDNIHDAITQKGNLSQVSMHPFSVEQNALFIESVYSRQSLCIEWKDPIKFTNKELVKERLRGLLLKFNNCLFNVNGFKCWLTAQHEDVFDSAHEIRKKLIYFETYSKLGTGEFSLVLNDHGFKKILPTSEANRWKLVYSGPKEGTKSICSDKVGFTIMVEEENLESVKQNLPNLENIYCDNIIYQSSPVCFKIVTNFADAWVIEQYLSDEPKALGFNTCEVYEDYNLTGEELEQKQKKEWIDARLVFNLYRFLNGD